MVLGGAVLIVVILIFIGFFSLSVMFLIGYEGGDLGSLISVFCSVKLVAYVAEAIVFYPADLKCLT